MNPPEVRFDPETGRVAVRTSMDNPNRTWFVFDPASGGHYALGTRSPDDVSAWLPYIEPAVIVSE